MTLAIDQAPGNGTSAEVLRLKTALAQDWQRALANEGASRSDWHADGGVWSWQADGVVVRPDAGEWSHLAWQCFDSSASGALSNFVIEVTISGTADAAGLSFGHFKDFLAPVGPEADRRLQLEIDVTSGSWAFRVDGQLQHRAWWDSAVSHPNDLLAGTLAFKARRPKAVRFYDLAISTFQSSCKLSVIITCYRFLQRLRVALRNWCHQSLPNGSYEILVANPHSPDGTHEYLAAVAGSYPHVRVCELLQDPRAVTNKAAMINRAFRASRGTWVWLTDADCVFPPTAAELALKTVRDHPLRLYYAQRRFLSVNQTNELVAGRTDGLSDFDRLSSSAGPREPDNHPWGYTQIVHRSILQRIPYREHVNHFAHSDSLFIQDCKQRGIMPAQIDGLFCLHLNHPFAWYGTKAYL